MSVTRIDKYMNSPEINENTVTKLRSSGQNGAQLNNHSPIVKNKAPSSETAIKMIETSYKWSTDDPKLCLQNISFEIPKCSLVAVVGQVGSGKSSLLSAILGEMEPVDPENQSGKSSAASASVIVDGSIAYAAQQAWIQNESVKNNILFRSVFKIISSVAFFPRVVADILFINLVIITAQGWIKHAIRKFWMRVLFNLI